MDKDAEFNLKPMPVILQATSASPREVPSIENDGVLHKRGVRWAGLGELTINKKLMETGFVITLRAEEVNTRIRKLLRNHQDSHRPVGAGVLFLTCTSGLLSHGLVHLPRSHLPRLPSRPMPVGVSTCLYGSTL